MQQEGRSVKEMIAEARGRIENLSAEQVQDRLDAGGALLVDLRDDDEVRRDGVIPGAKHVTRGMLEFRADAGTPYHDPDFRKDRPVVLYCASGGRSALAGGVLKEMGYGAVAHLDGGFKGWREEGRPVQRTGAPATDVAG